jgi:3-deoxy-7-phosphoheptulonate synthase
VVASDENPLHVLLPSGPPMRVAVAPGLEVGGRGFVVIAGPCAVESASQTEESAAAVSSSGAHLLRGGVFKPRTSPYAFQGLGGPGLQLLAASGRRHRLPVICEVMDAAQLPLLLDGADVLQVGARNMQNFTLLKALGQVRRPVLLKRGLSATLDEWMLAAEYIVSGGNREVILCERGIRTFETRTRNTLDLSAVAWVKRHCRLPVIVDPSHATGDRELILPMALAAAAAGADGLMVEVHPRPAEALCDGHQALTPRQFELLMEALGPVLRAVGRDFAARAGVLKEAI